MIILALLVQNFDNASAKSSSEKEQVIATHK